MNVFGGLRGRGGVCGRRIGVNGGLGLDLVHGIIGHIIIPVKRLCDGFSGGFRLILFQRLPKLHGLEVIR